MRQVGMIELYLSNWPVFFAFIKQSKIDDNYTDLPLKTKIHYNLLVFDIFVNTLTGGDPRETISSSLHKDRKSSVFAGLMINVIERFDDDHGDVAEQPLYGEGSDDNRELPDRARTIVVLLAFTGFAVTTFMFTQGK